MNFTIIKCMQSVLFCVALFFSGNLVPDEEGIFEESLPRQQGENQSQNFISSQWGTFLDNVNSARDSITPWRNFLHNVDNARSSITPWGTFLDNVDRARASITPSRDSINKARKFIGDNRWIVPVSLAFLRGLGQMYYVDVMNRRPISRQEGWTGAETRSWTAKGTRGKRTARSAPTVVYT